MGTNVKCMRMNTSLEFSEKTKTLLSEKADRVWLIRGFTLPTGCNQITPLRNVKRADIVGFSPQDSLFLCSSIMASHLA